MIDSSTKVSVSTGTFDDFLASEGLLEACGNHALKELLVEQLADTMTAQGLQDDQRISTDPAIQPLVIYFFTRLPMLRSSVL